MAVMRYTEVDSSNRKVHCNCSILVDCLGILAGARYISWFRIVWIMNIRHVNLFDIPHQKVIEGVAVSSLQIEKCPKIPAQTVGQADRHSCRQPISSRQEKQELGF